MRYFEVRLVLEALDDADAHKLAGRVGSGPNDWWSLPDLANTHDYELSGEIQ